MLIQCFPSRVQAVKAKVGVCAEVRIVDPDRHRRRQVAKEQVGIHLYPTDGR